MLEFVHLSGAEAGKDVQTRRKVRSQAMRDFRRRQREEREAANKDKSTPPSRKATAKRRDSPAWQPCERTGSAEAERPARKRTHTSNRDTPAVPFVEYTNTDDTAVGSAALMSSIKLYGDYPTNPHSADSVQDDLQPPGFSGAQRPWSKLDVREQEAALIPRSPSAWGGEPDDIFQSPIQINQMLSFCKSYIHWLKPGVDGDHAGKALMHAWESSSSPMLLVASCLASVGHLDAVQPNRPGGNYEVYKARVLREVSKRMRSSDSATSEEVMGALALLTSFELSRGSDEAVTHLRGLKSIVNMKGGIKSITTPHLTAMLETLDLLHATLFDSPLILVEDDGPCGTNEYTDDGLVDFDVNIRLSPLLHAELVEFLQEPKTPLAENLQGLTNIMSAFYAPLRGAMADINACVSLRSPAFAEHMDRTLAQLQILWQHICQYDVEADDTHFLIQAYYYSLLILYHIVQGRPQRHACNQPYVDALYQSMQAIRDAVWQHLPYHRVYMLLRAAVVANNLNQKSYFKAQLVRAFYQMGDFEWKRVKIIGDMASTPCRDVPGNAQPPAYHESISNSLEATPYDHSGIDPFDEYYSVQPRKDYFSDIDEFIRRVDDTLAEEPALD